MLADISTQTFYLSFAHWKLCSVCSFPSSSSIFHLVCHWQSICKHLKLDFSLFHYLFAINRFTNGSKIKTILGVEFDMKILEHKKRSKKASIHYALIHLAIHPSVRLLHTTNQSSSESECIIFLASLHFNLYILHISFWSISLCVGCECIFYVAPQCIFRIFFCYVKIILSLYFVYTIFCIYIWWE